MAKLLLNRNKFSTAASLAFVEEHFVTKGAYQ
jgi:hypothetical protein